MKQCGDEDSALRQGAESREQNFKQHISEQLILQIYQKNSKESNENNPDTPQSHLDGHFFDKPQKKYVEPPNQMKDFLKNSPMTFPASETIVLPHKSSDSTSQAATPNILGGNSGLVQGKSPTLQTSSTQMAKLVKRNESSQQLHSSSLNEDDTHLFHLPMSYDDEEAQIQENKVNSSMKASNSNIVGPGMFGARQQQFPEASFSGFVGTAQQTVPLMNSTLCDNLNDQSNYGIMLKQPAKYEQNESELSKPNDVKLKNELKMQSNRLISRVNNSTLMNSPQYKSANGQIVSDFLKQFKIMNHVKLFVSKLKSFTVQSNFQDLTQKHYELIGDASACFYTRQLPSSSQGEILASKLSRQISHSIQFKYFDSFRRDASESVIPKNHKIRKTTDIILHLIKNIPVFDTNSFFFIFWDMFMLLIQTTVFFAIPLCLSFNLNWDFTNSEGGEIEQILIGVFLIDTAITLNRGVYISGAVVMERNVIFQEYKRNVLFTDIVTIISLLNIHKYFQFLIFIRLKYAISITNRLDDHFQIRMRFPNFMKFVFMLSSIILVAHFCACLLYLVSRLSMELGDEKESLLTSENFKDTSLSSQYVNCLYMTLITMSTVGYGDIVPKNSYEKMYTMVMTMISSATFGYVVNTVGQIFTTISQRSASFDQKKYEITTYMNTRAIPKQIQMKAIKYLEYTQLRNRNNHLKGEIILGELPNQLTSEIKEEFFGKILQNCKLLQSNFSETVIKHAAQKMKEISLAPGQFLFQGRQKDFRIYFLLEGSLSVHIERQNGKLMKIASISERNAIIGQRSFFCEQTRSKWVKCEQSSNLAYIELHDFKESLLHFPIDYEVFCYMKDTITFEGKTADTPCASCDKFQHKFQDCPLLHLRQNKLKVIYSGLYSVPQERQKTSSVYRPNKKQKFQSLKDNQSIRMKLRQLRVDKIKEQLEELQKDDKKSLAVTINNNMNDAATSKNVDFDYEEEIKAYEMLLRVKSDRKFLRNVPSIEISDDEGDEGDGSDGNQAFPDVFVDEFHEPCYDEDDEKSDAISQSSSEQTVEISDRTKRIIESPSKIGINNLRGDGTIIEDQQLNLKEIDKSSSDTTNMLSASSKPDYFSNCQIRPRKISKTSQIEEILSEMRGQQMRQSAAKDDVMTGQFQTSSQISVTVPQIDNNTNNTNNNNNQLTLFGRQTSSSSNKHLNSSIPVLPITKDKDIILNNNNNPSTNKNSNNYGGGNTSHPGGINQSFSTALNYASLTHNDNILNTPRNTQLQSMFSNEQILKVLRKALSNQTLKSSLALNKRLSFQSSSIPKSRMGKSFYLEKQNKLEQAKTGEINSSLVSEKLKALLFKQSSQVQNNLAENLQEKELLQQQMIQEIIRKHQELFFYDFELAKKMVKYYPKQNMLNVVASFNRVLKMRMKNGLKNSINEQKSLPLLNQERNSIKIISPLKRFKDKAREHTENQYIPTSSLYKNKHKKMSIMQSNN